MHGVGSRKVSLDVWKVASGQKHVVDPREHTVLSQTRYLEPCDSNKEATAVLMLQSNMMPNILIHLCRWKEETALKERIWMSICKLIWMWRCNGRHCWEELSSRTECGWTEALTCKILPRSQAGSFGVQSWEELHIMVMRCYMDTFILSQPPVNWTFLGYRKKSCCMDDALWRVCKMKDAVSHLREGWYGNKSISISLLTLIDHLTGGDCVGDDEKHP